MVFYFSIVLLYERMRATPSIMAWFERTKIDAPNKPDEDEDVINEKKRLQSGQGQNDIIKVMGLRKVYKGRLGGGNKIAVQDLWMGIPEGQWSVAREEGSILVELVRWPYCIQHRITPQFMLTLLCSYLSSLAFSLFFL